ncbi:MAG: glycine--tRNA ligase subunit beta [Nitrospira sp.]|nr:glycine--tRNA ligase subunit beta [Nitrospira sp.]
MSVATRNNSSPVTHHSSLLLEIGTEEIPARFLPGAIQSLKEHATLLLSEYRISFSEINTYATPRRITLLLKGLPGTQAGRVREVFGPPKKVAFDNQGNPTQASLKFAKSQGISVESLVVKKKDKGEYMVAVIEEQGATVKELLPELLKRLVSSLRFPKTMRWGYGSFRFARPIHWILAMLDEDVIYFEIDGMKSGNLTKGHRFLSPGGFQIKDVSIYKSLLETNYVIINQEKRKKKILDGIKARASTVGGLPVEDEELLETVTFLVEYPVPVLCSFQREYLELPEELLITVMKDHQKFFAVEDEDGRLINRFIVVSNTKEENEETVRIGAERVIKARFEDAKFYLEEDRKKMLFDRIEDLKKVIFQERLGSLYEKTLRIVSTAEFLSEKLLPQKKDLLTRAAWISKTDLTTGIVREFPELQGIAGSYYALHDGEGTEIAEALREQYLPVHSGGEPPQTEIGALLSISDKVDNIASFFSIGLTPTGSEDPFALRRQALGIIAILLERGYQVSLRELIDKALQNLSDILTSPEEVQEKVNQFFEQRFEPVFSDKGYSTDLIHSTLFLSLNVDIKDIKERLDALERFKKEKGYNEFLLAIKRINNILPQEAIPELKTELLFEDAEKRLKEKLDQVMSGLTELLWERKYDEALDLLSSLTEPINSFFEHVLVMDEREEIRQNRLALLKEIWRTALTIADFSKLSPYVAGQGVS